ncbi:PRA1 family protein [Streptomyces vilmorinianum]|uniref:PRA1 family protein n=1 Tax=Streptomyces vilmorinianum TaxID=3051092 RepID=UPI0010FB7AC9|nr:PRA1 family protein [Streptomyces vilmorinianum]
MSRGTRTVPRSPGNLVRGAGRIVRTGLFLVFALVALTLSVPNTAQAIEFDISCKVTGDDSYTRDSPGANGESIIPAVNQWEKDKSKRAKNLNDTSGMITGAVEMRNSPDRYTFYEINGMRGLNWSMTFLGRGNASEPNPDGDEADKCSVMDMVNNGVANMVFNGTKILSRAAISIKELASNPSPLSGLYTGRDNAIGALRDNLFKPAVPAMILLTGIWVFTKWRQQQMREVWSGVGWACLTTIAVVALLAGSGDNRDSNYHKVIEQADVGIANFNSLLAEAVLSGMSGELQSPCDLNQDEKTNRGLRASSCTMYDTLVFRPWALGQFGENGANCIFKNDGDGKVENGTCFPDSTGTECDYGRGVRCEDLRVKHAVSQSTTNIDEFPEDKPEIDKEKEQWVPIRIDIAGGTGKGYPNRANSVADQHVYPVPFNDWAGQNAGTRVGLAFYSLVAALIAGVMVIVLSALTLLWHAVTLILIIMLPLVATIGIHPSQQKLLKGWLQTFIHSFVLRAGFGIILTVLLVLYQMILPARISLGMQLLMLILVTVAVVMMLKKLIGGAYSPKIAGAEDALGVGDMPGAVAAKAVPMMGSVARGGASVTGRVAAGTGRVAGGAAKRVGGMVGRGLDKKVFDEKLQKGGWLAINNSKRQQRKSAYQARTVQQDSYDRAASNADNGPASGETAQQAPRRTGRVSQRNTTPPPAATPAPQQQPAPQPVPQQSAPPAAAPRPPRVQPPQQPVVQQPAQPNPPQLPPQRPPGDGNRMPR